MKKIKKYLDFRFQKHKEKWDTFAVVTGYVGTGKSNLLLNMLEYWCTLKNGKCTPEDITHVGLNKNMFLKGLANAEPNDMVGFDEGGELTNRRAMAKFNTNLMIGYRVIRADNIFTVLCIDDVLGLDPYFKNSRLKALFLIEKRGFVKVWLREKARKLLALNRGNPIMNFKLVKPSFVDTFPEYSGVMKERYDILKKQKTTEARKKLAELSDEEEETPPQEEPMNEEELEKKKLRDYLRRGDVYYF